ISCTLTRPIVRAADAFSPAIAPIFFHGVPNLRHSSAFSSFIQMTIGNSSLIFFRLKEPSSDRLESGRQPRRCARGYRLVCNRASSRQPGERRHLLAVLCLGRGFLRLFRIKKTPRLGGGF